MLATPEKVFSVFKKHYKEIPLVPVSKTPFQILVAVMLSARTRDETTAKVCRQLFKVAPTPEKLGQLPARNASSIADAGGEISIENLIYPVGFYKTKAKHLKQLAQKVVNEFSGNVPRTLAGLTSLPGVGRKSANIVLARAFKIPAIGVDTHVHRISNILGWVKTKTPEQTEKELMKILPKKYWIETNDLFVSIGQQYRSKGRLTAFLKSQHLHR